MRKSRLHVGLLVLALTLGLAGTAAADYTWFSYGGHNYALSNNGVGWVTAEAEAVSLGGHLVTINNQSEQNWLMATFTEPRLWIGFTDKDQEGTWVWSSGETVTYTNWAPGQPENSFPEEDCAMLFFPDGGWYDLSSQSPTYPGIIEVALPVPVPSALWLLAPGLTALAAWRRRRG